MQEEHWEDTSNFISLRMLNSLLSHGYEIMAQSRKQNKISNLLCPEAPRFSRPREKSCRTVN